MESKRIYLNDVETKYLIYEDGSVYSELSSKFLKINTTRGYPSVCLRLNGKTMNKYIHRLVASHFLDEIDGYDVNHIDGNKMNNNVSNLEWVTRSQNIKHAYDNNLSKANVEQIKRAILKIDITTGNVIKEYNTIKEAAIELGNVNKSANIIRACQGKQKTSYGFKWEYKDGRKEVKWNEL